MNIMDYRLESDEDEDFIGFPSATEKAQEEVAEAIALAKQLHVYKPGIDFVPGSKLEVLDAKDQNWYVCRVVEVDWGELDILVHYEKWSVRFDEWLKMDSTRIRPAKVSSKEIKQRLFCNGEEVLAFWSPDGRYYAAKILKLLNDETYMVLFYDGFTKSLKQHHIKCMDQNKVRHEDTYPVDKNEKILPQTSLKVDNLNIKEELSTNKNLFEVKILDEKRKVKRSPQVAELFQNIRKRRRSDRDDEHEYDQRPSKRVRQMKSADEVDQNASMEKSPLTCSSAGDSSYKYFDSSSTDSEDETSLNSATKDSITEQTKIPSPKPQTNSIVIGSILNSNNKENSQLYSCPSSPSTSVEGMCFKGFESSSISENKSRVSKALSSLLELKMQDSSNNAPHLCPKPGCGKFFIKVNLLEMHIKHFHPNLYNRRETTEKRIENIPQVYHKVGNKPKKPSTVPNLTKDLKISQNDIKTELGAPLGKNYSQQSNSGRRTRSKQLEGHREGEYLELGGRSKTSLNKSFSTQKLEESPAEAENSTNKNDTLDKSDTLSKADSQDSIINCRCGVEEEDGLMLQCDNCLCWQHGTCCNIENEDEVPNHYICSVCDKIPPVHRSPTPEESDHNEELLEEEEQPGSRLESMMSRCQDLIGSTLAVSDLMHSLNLKLYISKKDDHPKLVMWHKKWDNDEYDQRPLTPPLSDDPPPLDTETNDIFDIRSDDKDVEDISHDVNKPNIISSLSVGNVCNDIHYMNQNRKLKPLNYITEDVKIGIKLPIEKDSLHNIFLENKDEILEIENEKMEESKDIQLDGTGEIKKEEQVGNNIDYEIKFKQDAVVNNVDDSKDLPIAEYPKEAIDDFEFNFSGLVPDPNDGPDLTDLITSNVELENLVHDWSKELNPVDPATNISQNPIIAQVERILPVKCRINLLEHIEKLQDQLSDRFCCIENQVQALENEMGLSSDYTEEEYDGRSSSYIH